MAKKSNFGNYKMIGKVFGGKPSAKSRKQKRKDDLFGGSIILPALAVVGYFFYTKNKKGQTMTETIDPNKNTIVSR
jgi:hypothetical protein